MNSSTKIDCRKCQHFYITWDPGAGYGCKAFGFKSAALPCLLVKSNSKQECELYSAKKMASASKLKNEHQ